VGAPRLAGACAVVWLGRGPPFDAWLDARRAVATAPPADPGVSVGRDDLVRHAAARAYWL